MVDKQVIEDIKSNTNIVDIIGEVMSLQKAGRNYLGLCPFHGEKTPSFNVAEDRQFYHCFGCGRSGDVFKFIEEYQGVSFLEAVSILAERLGIVLDRPVHQKQQEHSPHQALYDMHEEATKFYHAILMTTTMGEKARSYLYQRGMTDDILKHFRIGLAPAERSYLYQRLSGEFTEQDLLDSGLFYLSESNQLFDTFYDRIMFPLTNDKGQVLAFSGRVWQDGTQQTAKYKNSRSTAIFNKSYELYHMEGAKKATGKSGEIYLMEGFMDVIAAYRAGIENAVASMGTALTAEHVRRLKQFAKKLIIAYDGDKAGQGATAKALDEIGEFAVDVVRFPDGMDPDEYLQAHTEQDLASFLTQTRISATEFWIEYLKPDNLQYNRQAQISYVEQLAPLIAKERSQLAQQTYIHLIADATSEYGFDEVEREVNNSRIRERNARMQQAQVVEMPSERIVASRPMSAIMTAEAHLLYYMYDSPTILNQYRLREDFHFDTPEFQVLYQYLCQEGEIPSEILSEKADLASGWYRVKGLDLPTEVSPEDLAEIERSRERALVKREALEAKATIQEANRLGDNEAAQNALERIIENRRRTE